MNLLKKVFLVLGLTLGITTAALAGEIPGLQSNFSFQKGVGLQNGTALNAMLSSERTLIDQAAGTTTGTYTGTFNGTVGATTPASGSFTTVTGTSTSANALAVGPAGTTNPTLQIDGSTASAATGVKIKSAAAAGGIAVSAISSGTNESLTLDAKGSGTITLNGTATGNVLTPRAVLSSGRAAGIGYTTGAGCAVTQASSRTTGVTCAGVTGAITLVSAAGSATPASFTVADTSVAALDTIIINEKSGTDLYEIFVTAVAAGSFNVTFFTTGGTTTEQPVFNFAVLKGAAS